MSEQLAEDIEPTTDVERIDESQIVVDSTKAQVMAEAEQPYRDLAHRVNHGDLKGRVHNLEGKDPAGAYVERGQYMAYETGHKYDQERQSASLGRSLKAIGHSAMDGVKRVKFPG